MAMLALMSRQFVYEPLEDPRTYIRTFEVVSLARGLEPMRLTLKAHKLTDRVSLTDLSYTALSYQWGAPEPRHTILINGRRCSIRSNLWRFIQYFHPSHGLAPYDSSQMFWADAICINQLDVEEKSHQVALMGEIFASARLVLAWIGSDLPASYLLDSLGAGVCVEEDHVSPEVSWSSHRIRRSIDRSREEVYGSAKRPKRARDRDAQRKRAQVLAMLSRLGYWSRTWIMQEVGLARSVVIVAGHFRLEFDVLKALCHSDEWLSNFNRKVLGEQIQQFKTSPLNHLSRSLEETPLREILLRYADTLCQDPRDKVYALRSLATGIESKQLLPDYSKPACQLYWEVLGFCKSDRAGFERKLLKILDISIGSMVRWFEAGRDSETMAQLSLPIYGQLAAFRPEANRVTSSEIMDESIASLRSFTTEAGWRGVTYGVPSDSHCISMIIGRKDLAVCFAVGSQSETVTADWGILVDPRSRGSRGADQNATEVPAIGSRKLQHMHETCPAFKLIEETPNEDLAISWGRSFYKLSAAMVLALLIFDERMTYDQTSSSVLEESIRTKTD